MLVGGETLAKAKPEITVLAGGKLTELLFDNLENLLLVEFLRETLNGSQGLTTISLC